MRDTIILASMGAFIGAVAMFSLMYERNYENIIARDDALKAVEWKDQLIQEQNLEIAHLKVIIKSKQQTKEYK